MEDSLSLVGAVTNDSEIVQKIQSSRRYAQNLYAAFCNMQWQPADVVTILKDQYWTASWRAAGGIVARLRDQNEDYLDYYCSGMGGLADYDRDPTEWREETGFVPEGTVTDEVRADLARLGWHPVPYDDD